MVVNTSSMDGGIAPVPYASVYASSKAAISCLTEALAHQLIAAGTELRAAVFYPSGGLLDTGLWTAQRNRPDALQRTRPRPPAPGTTFEEFKAQLEAAGRPVEVMDLRELGRFCVQGVKRGDFIIGHGLDEARDHAAPPGRRHRGRTAPPGGAELMTATAAVDRPLHRRLGRRPRRRRHPGLQALPGQPLARRVRRLGRRVREPLRRPHRAHRLPQLGQRAAPGRDRVRRHRGRGALPQHGARPSSPRGTWSRCPPTPEDYERRWAGVQAHNRWLADFCAATPGRRAGIVQVFANDMDDAVAEVRWAAATFDALRRDPAALHPAQLPPAAAVGGPLRAALAGVRRSRRAHQHPRGQRVARLRRARGGAGHDADRDPLVQPPLGLAPHLLRRARAPPDPSLRRHRAGRGLAAPWPARPSTGSTAA